MTILTTNNPVPLGVLHQAGERETTIIPFPGEIHLNLVLGYRD